MTRVASVVAGIAAAVLVAAPGARTPPLVPLTDADYVEIETAYGCSLQDEGGLRRWITNLTLDSAPTGPPGGRTLSKDAASSSSTAPSIRINGPGLPPAGA